MITDKSKALHKGLRLKDAVSDTEGQQKLPIQKQYTALKAAEGTGEVGATMKPTSKELDQINQFTRKTVTADEVVAFKTLSCNDIPDRDDDVFSKECVKGFAALEGSLSPVGKSYMVSHDKTKLPKGRIFDAAAETVDGAQFLTNKVYIPNTESNKEFIENIDFGVNWAVSVGVQLGKSVCTIPGCDADRFIMGMWCNKGHDKGYYYDPNSDEKDDWGYPIPCDAAAPNAAKCLRQFEEPRDFYELSQVFLGAQYFAELQQKDPGMADLIKSAGDVPVIGLSSSEAKSLHVASTAPKRLTEARQKGLKIITSEGGVSKWVEDKLLYAFDPDTDDDVLCLGSPSDEAAAEFVIEDEPADPGTIEDDETNVDPEPELTPDPETPATPEEETMSKKAVALAALKAKLPASISEKLAAQEGDDNGLELVLSECSKIITDLQTENKGLVTKAAIGDEYFKSLKAEAVDWYVKAHKDHDNPEKGVETSIIDKMLAAAGEDTDLINDLIKEYKSQAQAKFPQAVRRSTFPDDPNERLVDDEDKSGSDNSSRAVRRIHG